MNDLRFAFRQLVKNPGFTAVAVLTLALGIGANTAIFSLLNAALLRSLPAVKDPDSLVTLYGGTERFRNTVFSYPAYVDMRDRNQVFSGVIALQGIVANVSTDARTKRVKGELVTGNYFDVLGVTPVLGRGFLPDEDRTPGTHPVAAISYRFWREVFGFDPDVVGKEVKVMEGYRESEGKLFYTQLLERVRSLPGVESVSLVKHVPLSGGMMAGPLYLADNNDANEAEFNSVGPGYFTTMKIPLLKGRDFEPADAVGNRLVAIINDPGARRFWPGQDPIGKKIRRNRNVWEIVGVAQDIHHHELRTRTLRSVSSGAYIYFPVFQDYSGELTLLVRTDRPNPNPLTALAHREIQTLDKDLPIFDVMTLDDRLATAMSQERAAATLLGIFSMLALTLAAVGLYGVIGYSVTQRTREIGIRMALGAERKDVLKMVFKQGMVFVFFGTVVGLAAALAATRILRRFLYEVSPTDPMTFVTVCALLALVALLACLIPARRAAKVDPMVALRYE